MKAMTLAEQFAAPIGNEIDSLTEALRDIAVKLHSTGREDPEAIFVRYAIDNAAIVAVTDVKGTITHANKKFCEITGYSTEELIGSNHRMVKSGVHDEEFFRSMYRKIAAGSIWQGEICNRRRDGSLYWVDTTIVPHLNSMGKPDSYTSIRFDITGRKKLENDLIQSREHLKYLADRDPLTGLANRRRFQEYADACIQNSDGDDRFYMALIDLDTFKEINDSFGHDAGDELLVTMASRLGSPDRPDLFVSRLGGDEFGIIAKADCVSSARTTFETMLHAVREPVIIISNSTRRCSASLGISAFPADGKDSASLFKAADLALYRAKALGRDRLVFFESDLRDAAERKAAMLAEIEGGLQREEFRMHYQPVVPISGADELHLEALMRWEHPSRGLLLPGAFKEGFSDPTIRADFGMFALERVFKDMVAFRNTGTVVSRVALNLTNSDFRSTSFVDRLFELARETGVEPNQICVEVTEDILLGANQEAIHSGLERLHDAGVEIALDDFGTGYASLTHLRQLPIDRVKIDKSFIANMVSSSDDQAIIRGIVDIAHSLGMLVTAEGVETEEQVRMVIDMGADQIQGWYYSKALQPTDLMRRAGA